MVEVVGRTIYICFDNDTIICGKIKATTDKEIIIDDAVLSGDGIIKKLGTQRIPRDSIKKQYVIIQDEKRVESKHDSRKIDFTNATDRYEYFVSHLEQIIYNFIETHFNFVDENEKGLSVVSLLNSIVGSEQIKRIVVGEGKL